MVSIYIICIKEQLITFQL